MELKIIFLLSFIIKLSLSKLELVVDVFRHGKFNWIKLKFLFIIILGARTPIYNIYNKNHFSNILGKLTPTGMKQLYLLGLNFRKHYIEDLKFLPEEYDDDLMYVRSSDFDRTLNSAESFLYGLYPLGTGPKIPKIDKSLFLPPYFNLISNKNFERIGKRCII